MRRSPQETWNCCIYLHDCSGGGDRLLALFCALLFPSQTGLSVSEQAFGCCHGSLKTILFTQTQHNSQIITSIHVLTSCFIMCSAYICFCWSPTVKKGKNLFPHISSLVPAAVQHTGAVQLHSFQPVPPVSQNTNIPTI